MGNACNQQQYQSSSMIIKSYSTIFNFQPTQMPILKNLSVIRTLQSFQKELQYESIKGVTIRSPMVDKNKKFIYIGEWLNQSPHGFGKIYFQNGEYFEGELRNGVAEGVGRFIFVNGEYYEGKIAKNNASGQGKFISNSVTFQGQWKDSKPFLGVFSFADGLKVQLKSDNQGIITWPDNKIYTGKIKDLNPQGYGKLVFQNGNVYQGQWSQGLMHGHGEFKWIDGSSYTGSYVKGSKEGEGKFIYKNSNRYYNGHWKSGKMHGFGKMFYLNKLIQVGIYENGVLVNKCEQEQMKKKQSLDKTQN